MIVYAGSVENTHELIQFVRREVDNLKTLRKLIISREGTVLQDVNGNGIEFPGLTCGCASLDRLLQEFGVVFPSKILHDPNAVPNGIREFDLSACWTWGYG